MTEVKNIPSVNIHGKFYTEVKDRVIEFRSNDKYKNWRLETEIIKLDDKQVMTKSTIFDNKDNAIAVGHAHEFIGNGVNKSSFIENCETSSAGRALGFLGIGIVGGFAPADDMKNVSYEEMTNEQFAELKKLVSYYGLDAGIVNHEFGISQLKELPKNEFNKAVAFIHQKGKQQKAS